MRENTDQNNSKYGHFLRSELHENNFDIAFRVILHSWETDLCLVLMTDTKYIVRLLFSGYQAKSVEYLTFINSYGKANKEISLSTVTHDWAWIVLRLVLRTVFYLHAAIFEIPLQRFMIKPPAC